MLKQILMVGGLSLFLLPNISFAKDNATQQKTPVQIRQECKVANLNLNCWINYGEKKNNPYAQMFLGTLYEHGISVNKNPQKAFYWYQKSAKNNFPRGLYSLAEAYRKGVGTTIDRAKAYEFHKHATMLGFEQSARSVGRMYAQEPQTDENKLKAYEWYYISTSTNRGSYKRERDAYGSNLTEQQRAIATKKALEVEKNFKQ